MWEEEPQVVAQDASLDRTNSFRGTQETSGDPGPFFGVDGLCRVISLCWLCRMEENSKQHENTAVVPGGGPHSIDVHRCPSMSICVESIFEIFWHDADDAEDADDVDCRCQKARLFIFLRFYDLGCRGGAASAASAFGAIHGCFQPHASRVSMSPPSATSRKPIPELLSEAKSEILYCTTFTNLHHLFSHGFSHGFHVLDGKSGVFLHLQISEDGLRIVLPRAAGLRESPFQLAPRQSSEDFEDSFCWVCPKMFGIFPMK